MPSSMTKKSLLLKIVLRYPKEDFCKQLKQRHWREYICPHGPGGRETPSPDERCPFPHSRGIPWALVNGDWTLRKMNKAALVMRQVLPAETIPEPSVTITDGTSLVQKMKGNDQTYSQHADSALTHILHEGVRSHRIDLVLAAYREDTVKNADISNINVFQNMGLCHRIQQWRKFLSSSVNKANLIRFLVVEWKTRKPSDMYVYVTSEEFWLHISKDQLAEVGAAVKLRRG